MGSRLHTNVLNAFLAPAIEHLQFLVGYQATVERLELINQLPSSAITLRIDINGCLEGAVFFCFDKTLARSLANKMLPPGTRVHEPELMVDAVSELANIIVGHASGTLLDCGLGIQFLSPQRKVDHGIDPAVLNLLLTTPIGCLRLVFHIKNTATS